ncbi:hypothetical protein ACP275_13G013500 [Erythranthe tilingii]
MRKSRQVKGFIVNTFLELEPHAILSFSDEKDEKIPPVYPVGPLITTQEREIDGDHKKYDEIIGWLDEQPNSSVVFLCFGSSGYFEGFDQVKEIDGVIVSADVIKRAVGRLMDPENEARVRVKVLKEKSRIALMEGESSYNFLGDLIADIMDNLSPN